MSAPQQQMPQPSAITLAILTTSTPAHTLLCSHQLLAMPTPQRQAITLPAWGAPKSAPETVESLAPAPSAEPSSLLDSIVSATPVSLLDSILRVADPVPVMPRLNLAPVDVPLSSLLADILDGGARPTDDEIADAYRINNNLDVARIAIAFRHRTGRDKVASMLAARRETVAQTMARRKQQSRRPCPTCGMIGCPAWGMP